jgi:hypothetical protein
MILQSWGGRLRIFQGVPDTWTDLVFHRLGAEGGFAVSAVKADGALSWLALEAIDYVGGGGERSRSCSMVLPTPSRHARLLIMPRRFWFPARRRQRERPRGVGMDCWRRTASEKDDRLPGTSGSLPAGETVANAVSISILFRVFFAFFFEIVFRYFGSAHGTLAGAAPARWTALSG